MSPGRPKPGTLFLEETPCPFGLSSCHVWQVQVALKLGLHIAGWPSSLDVVIEGKSVMQPIQDKLLDPNVWLQLRTSQGCKHYPRAHAAYQGMT